MREDLQVGLSVMRGIHGVVSDAYIVIVVEEAQGKSSGLQLGLDGIFLAGPPGHGNDLRVVLPRLPGQHGGKE